MLDSWGICQPSAWAFQTMPHNVLDSPEKQPGAWKLPAHHLNSLIWALSGSPSLPFCLCVHLAPSLSISHFLYFFALQAHVVCCTLYLTFLLLYSHSTHLPSSDLNGTIFLLQQNPSSCSSVTFSQLPPTSVAPNCKTAADAPY